MAKKSKKNKKKPYGCEFCKAEFVKEKTLFNHLCARKIRWFDKSHKYSKIGFIAYQKFYEISHNKKIGFLDFINSNFYTAFIKFGRHVVNIKAIEVDEFIYFLIRTNVKIDNWVKDYTYEEFLRHQTFRESAIKAVERNILLMEAWANEYNEEWTDFFIKVSPTIAVEYIRQGRLSPWVLLTCKRLSEQLFERMSNEQLNIAFAYIDLKVWNAKLESPKHKESIKIIQDIMKEAGF